jgi:hypothetical protein
MIGIEFAAVFHGIQQHLVTRNCQILSFRFRKVGLTQELNQAVCSH